MPFLRPRVLSELQNKIQFRAKHVPGIDNKIADAVSRKQWESFRRLATNADKDPRPIPEPFQLLLLQTTYIVYLQPLRRSPHIKIYRAFEDFRKSQGLTLSWLPTDLHLYMFIAHLSLKEFKYSTP